ncbi:alginate lyase family protein [Chitinophaga barathri]|uniref:Heparinase n=1 Tax=Chitinophaga barathri TaxID=1647451 RepID=A0A3N4MLY5_9BACT|nr:alginate lyase family protein [Chitinophaga barathri]RPD43007.1 heparinase [Chitinophaga barathri]
MLRIINMKFSRIKETTLFLSFILLSHFSFGVKQHHGEIPAISIEEICAKYPERIQRLFSSLNLDYAGLSQVKAAVKKNDMAGACRELVKYYRAAKSGSWLRMKNVPASAARSPQGDSILADIFTFQSVSGKQARLPNNYLDWYHLGPTNDQEWAFFINRHFFYAPLLKAYKATGNEDYVAKFSSLVADWVISNPIPANLKKNNTPPWRLLEAGLRMGEVWPFAFYNLQLCDKFSDATRILMLSSLTDHANYIKSQHGKQHNHVAMELNGLCMVALAWPEFKDAPGWYDHAVQKMVEELTLEVYPDGTQKELTNHYHNVALVNFEGFMTNSEKAGKKLPDAFIKTIESMYDYDAGVLRPDGFALLNNDSDLNDDRPFLIRAANRMEREDWKYVATNGRQGKMPKRPASVFYPYAGHMVMRNGWTNNAHWSFFDAGPWGLSHQHNDKLHFSLFANGQDLLVDAGRMYYKRDEWRTYFNLARSHNTILVDGMGQNQEPPGTVNAPLPVVQSIQPGFDFCMATFKGGFGDKWDFAGGSWQYHTTTDNIPVEHTRAVIYIKNKFWVVVDRMKVDQQRKISPLWHFNPTCEVKMEGNSIVTTNAGRGNLRITPVSAIKWDVNLIKGREKPEIQGWYSESYNKVEPNYCAQYDANIKQSSTFAWVMLPGVGKIPSIKTEVLPSPEGTMRMKIFIPGQSAVEIAVRTDGEEAVKLSNGLILEGACAVLSAGKAPWVAEGRIKDPTGKTVAESFTGIKTK